MVMEKRRGSGATRPRAKSQSFRAPLGNRGFNRAGSFAPARWPGEIPYRGMSERDLLVGVAVRQQEMGARVERIERLLEKLGGKVDAHDRAISRVAGVGGALALLYGGAAAVLGFLLRR